MGMAKQMSPVILKTQKELGLLACPLAIIGLRCIGLRVLLLRMIWTINVLPVILMPMAEAIWPVIRKMVICGTSPCRLEMAGRRVVLNTAGTDRWLDLISRTAV